LKQTIHIRLNGEALSLEVQTHDVLLDVLRRDLKLHGARETCGIGICGACTVLVDGKPLSTCLLLAPQVDGCEIQTIEGMSQNGNLHPIQQAFIDHNAFQCSYCTPAMILTARALLNENPEPDEEQIKEYLAGNLCRCGSYVKIIEAVKDASQRLRAERTSANLPFKKEAQQ
jgi:aerobic-type carbon monoxide dehydrogenase small subunit (CoxS/CutS family)